MKKTNLIWICMLLLISISFAQESYIYEQGKTTNIRISCFDENSSVCTASVVCGMTIIHPNSSLVINNGTMTHNGTTYNYSLTSAQMNDVGEYSAIINCDGDTDGYATFTYLITPNGENPSTALGTMYMGLFFVMIILFTLSLIATFKIQHPFYKAGMIGISYLLSIATIFITWNMASNFLTSADALINILYMFFRIQMVLFVPFIIALFIWAIFEFRKVKEVNDLMNDKGIPEFEAIARVRGKKW